MRRICPNTLKVCKIYSRLHFTSSFLVLPYQVKIKNVTINFAKLKGHKKPYSMTKRLTVYMPSCAIIIIRLTVYMPSCNNHYNGLLSAVCPIKALKAGHYGSYICVSLKYLVDRKNRSQSSQQTTHLFSSIQHV